MMSRALAFSPLAMTAGVVVVLSMPWSPSVPGPGGA
jgi:hypothetical protein